MSAPLEQLAGLVRSETGISLGEPQLGSLEAAVRRVDPALDAAALLRAHRGGQDGRGLLDRLIDEVTVNETFFFRQRRELDALDWQGLLDGARAAGRQTVRVWVAACSSGEEAYTLAMLASDSFASATPPVSLLGTDISRGILDRARAARYGKRAMRQLEPDLRRRHFVEVENGVEVGQQVRDLVEFRPHNLVTDPVPGLGAGSFDLIACRNVLIYFDGETVEQVIALLERGLAPGGTLLLGAADRLCGSAHRLGRGEPVGADRRRPGPERAMRRPLGHDRPNGAPTPPSAPAGVPEALEAANAGSLDDALALTERLLHENPLDENAYFVRGLAELGVGDPDSAVASLRRALYVDPNFGLAAFQLGRAHDMLGDGTAAARAYEQALHTLEPGDVRHDAILDQVDLGDVATACTMRLKALRGAA